MRALLLPPARRLQNSAVRPGAGRSRAVVISASLAVFAVTVSSAAFANSFRRMPIMKIRAHTASWFDHTAGRPRRRSGKVVACAADESQEEEAITLDKMSPDQCLDTLERTGVFEGQEDLLEQLRNLAAEGVHPLDVLRPRREPPQETPLDKVLDTFDIGGVAKYILERGCSRVVVMCGAGISTSAGIPDFRTPGTGLYDNLQRYNLSRPELIFDLDFFRESPGAFYELCKDMWPGNYEPTPAHYFIRLLNDKGILLRCYTQNIDSLERRAGLPAEKLVAAHGNFDAAHVIDTYPEKEVDINELKAAIEKGEPGWQELRQREGNLVKPKIVFFGEQLPDRFYELHDQDLRSADLLIVLGTSLVVQPFAGLVGRAAPDAPRVLINRDAVGTNDTLLFGFRYHLEQEGQNWRDVWHQADCDSGCRSLAAALGWASDLEALIASKGNAQIEEKAPWLLGRASHAEQNAVRQSRL